MITPEEVFLIGRLTRTHGTRGEVELRFTDDAFDRGTAEYLVLLIDGIFVPFFFEEYRFKNNEAALFKLEDVDNETDARRLVGLSVYYPHAALDEKAAGEMRSLQALTGFRVLLPDTENTRSDDEGIATRELGTVVNVATTPATTLLTLENEAGGELLIPYHEDFLVDADLRERYIVLNLPEGLLELND